ncbi:MAG: hypothetical protein EBS53_14015 [Bacteroidetes bacterium]|nr:hypothetical protein [Bacteroidota bacterium]
MTAEDVDWAGSGEAPQLVVTMPVNSQVARVSVWAWAGETRPVINSASAGKKQKMARKTVLDDFFFVKLEKLDSVVFIKKFCEANLPIVHHTT